MKPPLRGGMRRDVNKIESLRNALRAFLNDEIFLDRGELCSPLSRKIESTFLLWRRGCRNSLYLIKTMRSSMRSIIYNKQKIII
jgi:hypothetical protein